MRLGLQPLTLGLILVAGCGLTTSARMVHQEESGSYEPVPGMSVAPEEALELAQPYLDWSYQLRLQNRSDRMRSDRPPTDHISIKGEWYYIVRDNYPAIFAKFYLPHAVRVHGETGQVLPPE